MSASSPANFLHGCAELLIDIVYVIYAGAVIFNRQVSLVIAASEIKC